MIFNFDTLDLKNVALINPLNNNIVYYKELKEKCDLVRKNFLKHFTYPEDFEHDHT